MSLVWIGSVCVERETIKMLQVVNFSGTRNILRMIFTTFPVAFNARFLAYFRA